MNCPYLLVSLFYGGGDRTFTAIADQTSHKKNHKSVAKQRFYGFSWFGFERKAHLYHRSPVMTVTTMST
ncbi:hypothetical protein [Pseudanabaena sp. lw0831]|uniref:hypothetical protein n=1 Tax=Pseudanabaena sp. lw0831 TaxID=1357935 RepID=UPI0019168C5B|nr:hypothetical protein [Pseudanabaena sp. lw0831]